MPCWRHGERLTATTKESRGYFPRPSADWRESPTPDETERHAELAARITAVQASVSEREGPGRAFHRQQVAGLVGDFTVTAAKPELRHGLLSMGGSFEALVRLSHGALTPHPDPVPDIQGFALSVRGLDAPGALTPRTDRQDLLLINQPAFGFPTSEEFGDVALAAARGQLGLARHMIGTRGPVGGLTQLAKLSTALARPFTGFATTTFHSAAPTAYGPYAVKWRLEPDGAGRSITGLTDHHRDIADRLRRGPLRWSVQVQFFLSEALTPIEDMTSVWPESVSPWHEVARLTVPSQDIDSTPGTQLAARVERDRFDPWNAFAAHRPLGEVMRARKVAYWASAQDRGAD